MRLVATGWARLGRTLPADVPNSCGRAVFRLREGGKSVRPMQKSLPRNRQTALPLSLHRVAAPRLALGRLVARPHK